MNDQVINGSTTASKAWRYDGFMNILGGGAAPWYPEKPISGDNRLYANMTRFWHNLVDSTDLETIYNNNGIAATIIDRPADECFSKSVDIEGDDDELMTDEYSRLSVEATFSDAIRWARLFGSAAILIMAKDGGSWDMPLNLDALDTVEDLIVYDARHIRSTDRLYDDPYSPLFGKPEYYLIRPPGGQEFTVHETRLIPIGGDPLPMTTIKSTALPWWQGRPVLQACKDDIARLMSAYYWTIRLLERKQQGIYTMEGLGELFAQGLDDIVSKRINLVDFVRNNLTSVVVDGKDTYTVLNLGLDNLNNVIGELQIAICASSKFPSVMLFGKSTSSLNSTGAGELEQYYGMVNLIRERIARPGLERLTAVLWTQRALSGKIPDNWEIVFPPLWQPSEKEQADTNQVKSLAQSTEVTTLITLMDAQIITPEELRKIVANKYPEYDLPEVVQSTGGDVAYAVSTAGAPGAQDNAPPP